MIILYSLIIQLYVSSIHVSHANNLDKACKAAASAYKIDYNLLKAISIVESGGGTRSALRRNRNGTYDAGPFQINSIHWSTTCKAYNVSRDYGGAMCAAKLLAGHKKHSHTDPQWYGLYHSKTPSLKTLYANKIRVILNKTKGRNYVALEH